MEQLHSPQEMRFLSNLGHWIEGGILAGVALIALLRVSGFLGDTVSKYLWPGFVLLAGVTLAAFMLLHHGLARVGPSWEFVTSDPQQRQHFVMALLLFGAGAAELLRESRGATGSGWGFVWPAVLVVIGILFMVHKQHGNEAAVSWAATVHRYLGLLLVSAGLARAAEVMFNSTARWLAFSWAVLLLLSALLLLAYREPQGAYEPSSSTLRLTHGPH